MTPKRLELHIEELVLKGFAPRERHALADAFERELAHLIAAGGLPLASAPDIDLRQVDAGCFRVATGRKAKTTGAQIARAVYEGLRR